MGAAVGDHLQQAAARMLVFKVFLKVGRQLVDTLRQKSDLHLWRASIGVVDRCDLNYSRFLPLRKHGSNVAYLPILRKVCSKRGTRG